MRASLIECNWIDSILVSVVVLKQSMRSAIKNLYLLVCAARCQACTVWMEFNIINHTCMICETVYLATTGDIPKTYSSIISTWCNHSWITWKLRALYPVLVAIESLQKFDFIFFASCNPLFIIIGGEPLPFGLTRMYTVKFSLFHLLEMFLIGIRFNSLIFLHFFRPF